MKDIVRFQENERVDLQDQEYLTDENTQLSLEELYNSFLCSPNGVKKWIVSGFDGFFSGGGSALGINKGIAILSRRDNAVIREGVLTTSGQPSITIDISSFFDGVYGVYIRFEAIPGENESRIFWNPINEGSEYTQSISTRLTANWSARIEATSPGSDWMKIYEITVTGGTITDVVDYRNFYFEGDAANSFQSGWSDDGGGSALDRSPNRASYGVSNFQQFTGAMRQCIEDIKGRGIRKWYDKSIGGLNIGFDDNPVSDRLAIGADDFYLENRGVERDINLGGDDKLTYNSTGRDLTLEINGEAYFINENTFYGTSNATLGTASRRWGIIYGAGLDLETDSLTRILLSDTSQALDEKLWSVETEGGLLSVLALDDTGASGSNVFSIDRTGTDPGTLTLFSFLSLYNEGATSTERNWSFKTGTNGDLVIVAANDDGSGNSSIILSRTGDSFDEVEVRGNINPGTAEQYYLGTGSSRWNVYATDLYVRDNISGKGVQSSLIPGADGSFNLGSVSYRWGNIHTDKLSFDLSTGNGMATHLYPATADTYTIGTVDRNFVSLYLSEGARLKDGGGAVGISNYTTYTGDWLLSSGSNSGTIKRSAATGPNSGWVKIFVGTTAAYVPFWYTV